MKNYKKISYKILFGFLSLALVSILTTSKAIAASPAPSPFGCGIGLCDVTIGKLNFGDLNATIFGKGNPNIETFATPRGIISYMLPYLFVFAGLILFVMIIWGGFEMLTGAANPKSQEAGKGRITAGVIGFIIIFAAYWLAQLLQTIFGISILG